MAGARKLLLVTEGWRDSAFAREFLIAAGINPRAIEDRRNPGGSGHDWVKRTFVKSVLEIARFSEGRGVLGLIDEDGQGVESRFNSIDALLRERNLNEIEPGKSRCLLVPARNLETWVLWLRNHRAGIRGSVNEMQDYKISVANEDCRPAGRHLHSLDHTQMPADCPPMLLKGLAALREFVRCIRQ